MIRHLTTSLCVSGIILMSTEILAHEGHGHISGQGHTASHYLTEPVHLLQFAALALFVFVIGWLGLRWVFPISDIRKSS